MKFNCNGRFVKEEKYAVEQASKSMYSLLARARSLNLELDTQIDLFDNLVMPVLLYGFEVWGPSSCSIASKLQLKYYKYILKLKKTTPTNMVLGEVGKLPVAELIKI